jgi:large subunit ribosomal protein L25
MAATAEIKATARPKAGKGAARAVRREGKVPGVIYGDSKAAEIVALDSAEIIKVIGKGRFLATVFDLVVDGKTSKVIPRDVQLDPVKDFPLHVDFQRISPSARIRVSVPCKFINEGASPGLKRGGVLNIVRHDVEVYCPADSIPEKFEFDMTGLDIGRSIHISATKLPEGVKLVIFNRDFTVATIAGAKAEEEPTATTAVAEGAVPAEGAAAAPGAAPAAGDAKAGAAPAKGAAAPAKGGAAAAPAKGAAPAAGGKAAAAPAKPAGGKK